MKTHVHPADSGTRPAISRTGFRRPPGMWLLLGVGLSLLLAACTARRADFGDFGELSRAELGRAAPSPTAAASAPVSHTPVPHTAGPVPLETGPVPLETGPVPLETGPVPLETGPVPHTAGPASLAATPSPSPLGTSILTLRLLTPTATHLPLTTPWLRTAFPTQDICPTAVTLGIPCPTFVALFGGRQTPFPSPTPQPPAPAMTPVATAAALQSLGWSPDGAWLAFWSSTSPPRAPDRQPGELAFYDARQDKVCRIPRLTSVAAPPNLEWLADGQVPAPAQVRVEFADETPPRAYQGLPCQPESFRLLSEAPPVPTQTPASPYPCLSLGGEYRAETELLASQGGVLTFVTRLLPVQGGSPLVEKTWQLDKRLGDYAGFLGGEWLSPTQFLISETLGEGPLILSADFGELSRADGEVLSVLKNLLGESRIPSILEPDDYNLKAVAIPAAIPDAYHLLLYGVGVEASFPDVRLYHGEFGLVEPLPFKYIYAVSPDEKWLVMDSRPIIAGYEAHALYIRPLELVDGDWALLAWDADNLAWSPDWSQMAYSSQDVLTWQDFPDLNLLGRWQAPGYQLIPLEFSPDGCRLAALGVKTGGSAELAEVGSALFVPQAADGSCTSEP